MFFDALGGCQLKIQLDEIDIDIAGFICWGKGRIGQIVKLADHRPIIPEIDDRLHFVKWI